MSFGPDFFEEEPTPAKPERASKSKSDRGESNRAPGKTSPAAYVGLAIGLLLAVFGMSFGSLIAPDADGVIKLYMLGVAVLGGIVFAVSLKKIKS